MSVYTTAEVLRAINLPAPVLTPCPCPLAVLAAEQSARWRQMVADL
jgi:hypothetical protein